MELNQQRSHGIRQRDSLHGIAQGMDSSTRSSGKQLENVEFTFPQTTAAHFTGVVDDKLEGVKEGYDTNIGETQNESGLSHSHHHSTDNHHKGLKDTNENLVSHSDLANIDTNMFVRDAMMKAGLAYDEDGSSKDHDGTNADNEESLAVEEVNRAVTQAVAAVSRGASIVDGNDGVDADAVTDAAVIAAAVAAAEDAVRKRMQSYLVEHDLVPEEEDSENDSNSLTKGSLKRNFKKVEVDVKNKKRKRKKDSAIDQETDNSEEIFNLKIQEAIEKVRQGVDFGSFDPKKFNKEETELIDKFVKEFESIANITHETFLKRIWGNERRKDKFWDILQQLLPARTRSSLYKHVRRTYHIFEKRGIWSAEEDAKLAELGKNHEGNWKYIGEELKRMPEDCRDRWRNYVKCGSSRNVNKWTVEEEKKLDDIVSKLKETATTINWTVVSEMMDGRRSRIQCRYKWKKLRRAESVEKLSQMDSETQRWLINRLSEHTKKPERNGLADVNWDILAGESRVAIKSNPIEWSGEDFQTLWEKLSTGVKLRDKSVSKLGFHAEVAHLAADVAQLVEEEQKVFVS